MIFSFVQTVLQSHKRVALPLYRYWKYLSFKKIINFFVLHLSFRLSLKHPYAHPFFVSIEPTTACNLRCPQCPSGLKKFTRPTGNLQENTLNQILRELKPYLLQVQFYFQGEPFIHPRLPEFIRKVHDAKIYTSVSTNAHFINEEKAKEIVHSGLDELIISLDGMTQETYSTYRLGGEINRVFTFIETLNKAKKECHSRTPYIHLQFIVFRHNEAEIPMFIDFTRRCGADAWSLKGAQVYDMEDAGRWLPLESRLSRYEKKNGTWMIRNDFKNECRRMWTGCVFTWDGTVVPCCFDKDATYSMGNIIQQSWKDIWNGNPYKEFRNRLRRNRKSIDICQNCTEGTKGVYQP